jgi:hypothetical protein
MSKDNSITNILHYFLIPNNDENRRRSKEILGNFWAESTGHNTRFFHFLETGNPWKQGMMLDLGAKIKSSCDENKIHTSADFSSKKQLILKILEPIEKEYEERKKRGLYDKGIPYERVTRSIREYTFFMAAREALKKFADSCI